MDNWRDLPVSPADKVGPTVRAGVVRTGLFRDRLVVRGNPIGAMIDWIRGFCSPLPQEQLGEGDYDAEGDAASVVSPDDYYGGFAGGSAADFPYPPTIGGGAQEPLPEPAPAPVPQEDPLQQLQQARAALREAQSRRDCAGVQQVLDTARFRRGAPKSSGYTSWQSLAVDASDWIAQNRKECRK